MASSLKGERVGSGLFRSSLKRDACGERRSSNLPRREMQGRNCMTKVKIRTERGYLLY